MFNDRIVSKIINDVNIYEYREHPRIIELKVVLIHDALAREYSEQVATGYFQFFCSTFRINWTFISGILAQKYNIKRLGVTNRHRYYEEILFMGEAYDETKYHVATKYMGVSRAYVYKQEFSTATWLNEDWAEELDASVNVCGNKAYRDEAINLLEAIENLQAVLGYVSISKKGL